MGGGVGGPAVGMEKQGVMRCHLPLFHMARP